MDTVIETRGLTKRYGGDVCALYDADVSVRRGDIFGVVGDNGAGKTTLFKLLCGLAFPTEGEVRLFGAHEPRELERQRTRIGSIIESPGFYPGLSVEKNLECCRIRKGVPGKDAGIWGSYWMTAYLQQALYSAQRKSLGWGLCSRASSQSVPSRAGFVFQALSVVRRMAPSTAAASHCSRSPIGG